MSDNPKGLRWADPGLADTEGQRELIIAIANLTGEVMRLADGKIDVLAWTRLREVDVYAGRRGVDRATAISELVNAALSYGLDAEDE